MEYSEARQIYIQNSTLRIFRVQGSREWKCIFSEIPTHQLLESRQGAATNIRSYASETFLTSFCDNAKLFTRPTDGDLYVLNVEHLRNFDLSLLDNSVLLWTDGHQPVDPHRASTTLIDNMPNANDFLNSMSLDFRADLTLPSGVRAPFSIRSWTYGLKRKQLSGKQREFVGALSTIFHTPASTHRPISPGYAENVVDTLLKIWGVCMKHLGFTERDTRSLKILSPHVLSFYFRFLANERDGRMLSASVLETERQAVKHLVQGLSTLTIHRAMLGLSWDDIREYRPTNVPVPVLKFEHIEIFVERHIKRALQWAPNKGKRKKERVDIGVVVSNQDFIVWGEKVKSKAKEIQASSGPQTARTEDLAQSVQDLLIQGLLGALYPPQRSDVLKSLVIGTNDMKCAVPGCHMPTCRGNRVLTREQYECEYGSTSRHDHDSEYEYFIVVAHAKNYANEHRARFQGPTVHTPQQLGPTVQFLLHEIVTWAGGLLRELHGDQDDEEAPTYAFTEYVTGGPYVDDAQDRFNRHVQRITSPEVGLSPCNFRFLFVRKVEIQISQELHTVSEADSIRSELARQMLTSLEQWRKIYALPAPSLPQPGHQLARALAFGNA